MQLRLLTKWNAVAADLKNHGPSSPADVSRRTSIAYHTVSSILVKLCMAGRAERVRRGCYRLRE
jgi:hypothetical protein